MKPRSDIAKWLCLVLAVTSTAACGGGDGGSKEGARPGHYQTPSQGVVSGPDGETLRLGTDPGTNSQEQAPGTPEAPSAANCEDANNCEAVCRCLGQSPKLCKDYCDAYYGDSGQDAFDSGSGTNQGDVCASLNDPCLSCVCRETDVTACSDECSY